jgi:signal transduction histidine kinase
MLVVEPEMRAKGIALVQELSDDARILVDEKRAQQALMNVIMNAIQAVPETGGRIRIAFKKQEPYGVVTIEDNGCGIEEKNLKEVTKPFFTTRAEGSGLGLSIVKTVMDEHGGRLSIESKPGAGTAVSLSFPLAPEHSGSPRAEHVP